MSTDNEVIPSALACIAPILHVADEIEKERPRVAYLCRVYALEKACRVDPGINIYRGRGVSQFKTLLQQRLERDNAPTLASRVKKTDAREIESFYQQYYEHYVKAICQGKLLVDRAQQEKIYETCGVLFEVFCAVDRKEPQRDSFPVVMKIHSRL